MAKKKKAAKKKAMKSRSKAASKAPKKPAANARKKSAAPKKKKKSARAKGGGKSGLSLRSAGVSYTVNDIEASLAFYRDVLGFTAKERWEDQGTLRGVEMSAGKVSFMLGQDDWQQGRDRDKGAGVRIYCTTDQDVDSIAARIKANGGTLAHEPKDEWGMRAFALMDPDGYKITIARKLGR